MQMDPQQRLALELSWEALEDARIRPSSLTHSQTGVYLGAFFSDYDRIRARLASDTLDMFSTVGGLFCYLSNRVSYALGLHGPSFALDSACSSSLVAVHLACQSLRLGECDLALAGGVNLMLDPATTEGIWALGALSPDGRCHTFDRRANGYVRGEGGGVVVLARLSSALEAGAHIHAVIRGSAVNNDGPSNGQNAPNPEAQRRLISTACSQAGVGFGSIDYVELHGTGTALGDPIEASALQATYASPNTRARPLLVGSVKTNVGHLEAAAGVTSLIKVALALHNHAIPPSLNFSEPNPHIDVRAIEVIVENRSWPESGRIPRAAVSSFGLGGTNAHMIVDAPPRDWHDLGKVGIEADIMLGSVRTKPVFVFSGMGSQWAGMGRSLYAQEPAYRAAIRRCDAVMREIAGWSIIDELFDDSDTATLHDPDRHDVYNPVVIAVQIGMFELWRAKGIEPAAVIGHCIGEVAAAYASGALDLRDAMTVIHAIGHTYRDTVEAGGTAAAFVACSPERVMASIPPDVSLACLNDATSCVISGSASAVAHVLEQARRSGAFCKHLSDVSTHCAQVEPFLGRVAELAAGVRPVQSVIPMISTTTATVVHGNELDAAYWAANIRQPVRFRDALRIAIRDGLTDFIELSAHGILARSIRQELEDAKVAGTVIVSARRDEPAKHTFSRALAAVNVASVAGPGEPCVLAISAKSSRALNMLAQRYRNLLSRAPEHWRSLCAEAARGRDAMAHRLAVVARSANEAIMALDAGDVRAGHVARGHVPVFVFQGHGGQWATMGRDLYLAGCKQRGFARFRRVIAECDEHFVRRHDWSLIDELRAEPDHSHIGDVAIVQRVIFAVQVAVAEQLRAWGVVPGAVVGHSVGEVAAAHVAGILDLEHAIDVIVQRGRAVAEFGAGGMLALGATERQTRELIDDLGDRATVAVVNSRNSTVISAGLDTLHVIAARAADRNIRARRVEIDFAAHGVGMRAAAEQLRLSLLGFEPRPSQIEFFSSVAGGPIAAQSLDRDYWASNVERPVRFADAFDAARAAGHRVFVEVGGHPILATAMSELAGSADVAWIGTLRRHEDGVERLVRTLAELFCAGATSDLAPALEHHAVQDVTLPTYAWDRTPHWLPAAKRATAEGLVHRISWLRVPDTISPCAPTPRAWLVVGKMLEELVQLLREQGDRVLVTSLDVLDAASKTLESSDHDFAGIVYAGALDERFQATSHEPPSRALQECLQCLQWLARRGMGRFWAVTREAAPIDADSKVNPAQHPLWGLAKVAALEWPDRLGGIIDIDGTSEREAVVRRLCAGDGEPIVAVRGPVALVPRIERIDAPKRWAPEFAENDAVIITGGLGAIGRRVASGLVDRGLRRLWLVTRTGRGPEHEALLSGLSRRGVDVRTPCLNLLDSSALSDLIAEMATSGARLAGIVHAAGVVSWTPMGESTVESLEHDMAAKVAGGWLLHELTKHLELDFFVLVSSIASVWGSSKQAGYCAANHFLDGLAHHRRALGLPATSVNWGPWAGGGMADDAILDELESVGVHALDPETSAELLLDSIGCVDAQIVIADVDWDRFIGCMETRRRQPLFDRLRRDHALPTPTPQIVSKDDLAKRLERIVSQTLGIPLDDLHGESNLIQLGLDSLGAIELRDRLAAAGLAIPLRILLGDTPLADMVNAAFSERSPAAASMVPMSHSARKWLIVPQPRSRARMRLVCLPYAGGGPAVYSRWPMALGEEIEVIVAQLPARGGRLDEPPMWRVPDIVAKLTEDFIEFVQPPYALFGHCLGALIGHELILALRDRQFSLPSYFFASGARAPQFYNPEQLAIDIVQYSPLARVPGHELPDDLFLDMLRDLNFDPSEAIFRDEEVRRMLLPAVRADLEANNLYVWQPCEPLDVPAMVFGGRVDPYVSASHVLGWRSHFRGEFGSLFVPGDHFFIERQRDALISAVAARLSL